MIPLNDITFSPSICICGHSNMRHNKPNSDGYNLRWGCVVPSCQCAAFKMTHHVDTVVKEVCFNE